ncbi:MAG TPA: DUF4175 family protein, partial [Verrucomicrobiae bacterium]
MSELQAIESVLDRAARRLRWQHGWGGLWRGLLVGVGLWLAGLALYKLLPLPILMLGIAAGLSVASAFVGFLIGFWRQPSRADVARWIDAQQHLEERLSTALEFARANGDPGWRQMLFVDAARAAGKLDPSALL